MTHYQKLLATGRFWIQFLGWAYPEGEEEGQGAQSGLKLFRAQELVGEITPASGSDDRELTYHDKGTWMDAWSVLSPLIFSFHPSHTSFFILFFFKLIN